MPAPMRKSMTYDRGKEMSAHAQLRTQRRGGARPGTAPGARRNENTNGLLRSTSTGGDRSHKLNCARGGLSHAAGGLR